jgi:hypothetical protein
MEPLVIGIAPAGDERGLYGISSWKKPFIVPGKTAGPTPQKLAYFRPESK